MSGEIQLRLRMRLHPKYGGNQLSFFYSFKQKRMFSGRPIAKFEIEEARDPSTPVLGADVACAPCARPLFCHSKWLCTRADGWRARQVLVSPNGSQTSHSTFSPVSSTRCLLLPQRKGRRNNSTSNKDSCMPPQEHQAAKVKYIQEMLLVTPGAGTDGHIWDPRSRSRKC